jgi:hypothetical protein
MRKKVSHHTSVIIIESEEHQKFMFHQYDNTYPRASMRSRVNLIGGNFNPDKKTCSPLALLDQELVEEFSIDQPDSSTVERNLTDILGEGPGAPQVNVFAPEREVALMLGILLLRRKPYQDFLYTVPSLDGRPSFDSMVSAYHAFVPLEIFSRMEELIIEGKGIRNEGLTKILTADDLKRSVELPAWHTGEVMEHYLKTPIPNTYGFKSKALGKPRENFTDYTGEFEYSNPVI